MSFPRYPEYKDSGVEWFGEVPAHWALSRLKFFGELTTGITPPSEDSGNYFEAGWPWITPDDLDDTGSPVRATKFLTDKGRSFCRPVASMSTLVCCIGSIGKLGYTEEVTSTNQQITAIQPFHHARYLFYLLHAAKPDLNLRATGNVLRILNAERLGNVSAVRPSIKESTQIAAFLDHETARIDALVAEQQRLIGLLKEKRQAVISHAVTKGLNPDVPMKDSGVEWLGEVPVHWDIKPLRSAARKDVNSFTDGDWIESPFITDYGVRLIQTGNIGVGEYKEQGFRYISEETFKKLKCTEFKAGDVLICRLAEPVGRACLAPDLSVRMITSVDVCILSTNQDFSSKFLVYFLSSRAYLAFMESASRGGTRERVSRSFLGSVRIVVPDLYEQLKIVATIDSEVERIDLLVDEAESAICLLQERRSALISAAVTGKIDVRGWQPPQGSTSPTETTVTEPA